MKANNKRAILTSAGCAILMGGFSLVVAKKVNDTPIYMYKTEQTTYLKTTDEYGKAHFQTNSSTSKYLTEEEIEKTPLLKIESASSWNGIDDYDNRVQRNEYKASYLPADITLETIEQLVTAFEGESLEHSTEEDIFDYCLEHNITGVAVSHLSEEEVSVARSDLKEFTDLEDMGAFDKMTVTNVDYDFSKTKAKTKKEILENYFTLGFSVAASGIMLGSAINKKVEHSKEKSKKRK